MKPAVKESKSNAANKNNKQTKPAAQKQEKTMQDKRTPLQTQLLQLQMQYKNLPEELWIHVLPK